MGSSANALRGSPNGTLATSEFSLSLVSLPLQGHNLGVAISAFPLPFKGNGAVLHELGGLITPAPLSLSTSSIHVGS